MPRGRRAGVFAVGAAALVFPLLVLLRRYDDNAFTSWRWMYPDSGFAPFYAAHLAGIAVAAVAAFLSPPRRWRLPLLFLAAVLAGAGTWSEPEAIVDAARYFSQAKHLSVNGIGSFLREWGDGICAWTDLPLVPFLYGLLFRFFGEHRPVPQGFTTLLFALTALLTAGIGRRLWSREVGERAGWLLLGAPFLLVQVPLLLVDVPTMFAVALALYALLVALEAGGTARPVVAGLAIAAAFLVKYSTWMLLVPTLGVAVIVACRRSGRAALGRALLAAGVAGLCLGIFVLAYRETVVAQLQLLATYQREGLARWGESYASTLLFQIHPALGLFALFGIREGWRRRDGGTLIAAVVPLVLLLMQVRRSRYLMPALPMLALLAASGLEMLRERRVRAFVVGAAVSFSLVTALLVCVPFLKRTSAENLRAAGAYLDAEGFEVAEVYVAPLGNDLINPLVALPLLDYYSSARLTLHGHGNAPPPPGAASSQFRFTWDCPPAQSYPLREKDPDDHAPLVVVAGVQDADLPAEGREAVRSRMPLRDFSASGVFRSNTLVRVYASTKSDRPREEK